MSFSMNVHNICLVNITRVEVLEGCNTNHQKIEFFDESGKSVGHISVAGMCHNQYHSTAVNEFMSFQDRLADSQCRIDEMPAVDLHEQFTEKLTPTPLCTHCGDPGATESQLGGIFHHDCWNTVRVEINENLDSSPSK